MEKILFGWKYWYQDVYFSWVLYRNFVFISSNPLVIEYISLAYPYILICAMVAKGGTAFNGVVEELKQLTTRVAHVLPVSDDGGSTAEIVRVLGEFPNHVKIFYPAEYFRYLYYFRHSSDAPFVIDGK